MPKKIGHFELLSEIAKSSFGTVYKATDPGGQTVALKAIQLSAFGERAGELEKALLEEVENVKPLSNSGILPLLGAGEMEGQFCASMEYVQGNSIATMVARKEGFSIWDLLDIGRQVCNGLDYAHSQNAFHFSLEPAKIMCGWDGGVRILSLGISSVGKFLQQDFTPIPSFLCYMSPEQLRGEPIDARSNLFTLGAMFYEMVTDRRPFNGEDAGSLRQSILESIPAPPAKEKSKIHPALSDLIMKALEKDPSRRYQSGRELLDDLEKCKETKPQAAKKAPEISQAAAPKAKAAAAAAATSGDSMPKQAWPKPSAPVSAPRTPSPTPAPSAKMSSAVAEPEIETFSPETSKGAAPKIALDPMMAEEPSSGPGGSSFSEISELPPLKEVYVAPEPPPSQELADPVPASASAFLRKTEEKPRIQPREAAQKAIKEIKNVPPRLLGYSIAAAAAVILIIAVALTLHIHGLGGDDESATTKPVATSAQPAPTRHTETPAAPVPTPTPEATEATSAEQQDGSVPSPAPRTRGGRKKAVAAAPVVIPGQMSVESNPPGAQIQIDGQTDPSWVTPLEISSLEPGEHSLVVSKAGYASDSRKIDVAAGSKGRLTIHLAPLMATLSVASNPTGASIFIDGHDTGKVTPAHLNIDKGQHVILVRMMGYLDETATAQGVPGQTVTISPSLRALGNADNIHTVGKMKKLFHAGGGQVGQAKLTVHTQPKGAQIAINQHILDKNSPVDVMLDPGTYVIDLTLSGYAPVHKIVTADRDGKLTVDEVLQPR
ncbi:MAG TPA: PEGA domain-containing protein [Candidatus Sulfotelmatobacter sp.]|nr:PEGA domain-containing protein [Candidatus Sulfotelmatobacter sp.]